MFKPPFLVTRKGLAFFLLCCMGVACTADSSRESAAERLESTAQAVVTAVFPVSYSANSRYLEDANHLPFPILGRTAWFVTSLSTSSALSADNQNLVDDSVAKGFNAIEFHVINHDPRGNHPPFNNDSVRQAPFLKRLSGANWDGSLRYSNIASEAPDFTTPNEIYWAGVDKLIQYCQTQGVLVFMFPAYVGAYGGDQGWMQELVANGDTRMRSYGAWIANRYRTTPNIVWMMGGDMGDYTPAQASVEKALRAGMDSVANQQSRQFSAEWDSNQIATDHLDYGPMTLNSAYSWVGDVSTHGRRAYSYAPTRPAFLLEEPYDEEGSDGNSVNPNATQPVRRFEWSGWLSTIGGYVAGNGYIWQSNPNWQNHLNTQGAQDLARLNTFVRSIRWHELVPSGLGSPAKNLVTAGGSSPSSADYVAAASTPDGKLLVAYVPPAHTGSLTIDMSALSGNARARWFNPATAAYSDISGGSYSLPNTGTRVFSPPGNNGSGYSDWVLVLDVSASGTSAPPTVASAAVASPASVSATTSKVSALGADDQGEAALTYSWSSSGPRPVTFSASGSNAAKSSVATFTGAGSYTLLVTITDAQGQSVTSSANVSVAQTLSGINVSPPSAALALGATQQFSASARDQFGTTLPSQPTFAWSVNGGGSIDASGLFRASTSTQGTFTVTATSGSASGTASVSVGATSVTMGDTTIASTDDWGNGNLLLAQRAVLGQTATLQSLSFYVTAAAGKLRLAVYDATGPGGGPGAKRAETAELTPSVGWNTAAVASPVSLPAGTYWLSYFASSNDLHFRLASGGGARLYSLAYGALPSTFSTSAQTDPNHWSFYATLSVASGGGTNLAPTVATGAASSSNPVSGTQTLVSALGADDAGEANLKYTWATTGSVPAPVSFSSNGTNAGKASTATFTRAGTYTLQVTIADAQGLAVTSSLSLTVNTTLTTVAVSPSSTSVATGGTQQFGASGRDQFGTALTSQPSFGWSVNGGGTIDAAGLFRAGGSAGGPYTVTATSGGVSGGANVTVGAETQAPSAPGTLTAGAASQSAINLSWSASTDNVGVTGYIVYRCQGASCTPTAQVGTSATTSYADTGLQAATAYTYSVKARDAAGNLSAASAGATATTNAASVPPATNAAFIQVAAATPQSPQQRVSVTLPSAQVAGNLNIVAIGWSSSTSAISSVTDSQGNTYQSALPLTRGTSLSQGIYFATNVRAGSNTVTVNLSAAVAFPDVRVLEYSGVRSNAAVLGAVSAAGNTATAATPPVSASAAGQLVFAAGTTIGAFTAASNGFASRIITTPDADIAMDRTSSGAASYTPTATLYSPYAWVMQAVVFQ